MRVHLERVVDVFLLGCARERRWRNGGRRRRPRVNLKRGKDKVSKFHDDLTVNESEIVVLLDRF